MKNLYIVTGANGHLGSTLVRMLQRRGAEVRGLLLPQEQAASHSRVTYYHGDVREKESLRPLFEDTGDTRVTVIHTAGIIDISEHVSPLLYDVNVGGTRNMVELCEEYRVYRMVYVSSVHAIPEKDKNCVLHEVRHFSPNEVVGGYAKTKAEATQIVLDAADHGLNAVVVHPSGILGPYDRSGNHLVQMVADYIHGKLPACVNGGYDFVDVRDVAAGCLAAAERGRRGECYILSNRHYDIKEVLHMVKQVAGGRRLPVLPMWMAKAAAPLMSWQAKRRQQRPLYTKYSLYTLKSNDRFSHDKATSELGYKPRDLFQTIRDTVMWMRRRPARA
ncbi:MAG: NAD-dependent epimerase/dehydratase family protein [Acutalibacteraceae bacterium]